MNPKALYIIVALSISTSGVSGANLRGRKDYSSDEKISNLPAVPEEAASPFISLDKTIFEEGEPITVRAYVGASTDPFYSTVPTHLDFDFRDWSIGLFMRDADPQGGTLSPIVSISCSVVDCDVNSSYPDFNGVTFGRSDLMEMQGRWPLEVADFGTGFDAWVLDGHGAAAIGPFEFYVRDDYSETVDVNLEQTRHKTTSTVEKTESKKPMAHDSHPLAKYRKGTMHSGTQVTHSTSNSKLVKASGLQSSGLETSQAIDSSEPVITIQNEGEGRYTAGTISSNKEVYEDDETIAFAVSVNSTSSNYTGWRIGIFMRMANPQGGALPPIVSLPICPESGCVTDSEGSINTLIVFGMDTQMNTKNSESQWPIDLYSYGTGFDAYILDEQGNEALGPAKFNIMMPDDN